MRTGPGLLLSSLLALALPAYSSSWSLEVGSATTDANRRVELPLRISTNGDAFTVVQIDLWLPPSVTFETIRSGCREPHCAITVTDFTAGRQIEIRSTTPAPLPPRLAVDAILRVSGDAEPGTHPLLVVGSAWSSRGDRSFYPFVPATIAIAEPPAMQQAQTAGRRRAVRTGPVPSSADLIDKALAEGTINSDTALLYKVLASFADGRLPQEFRGDDQELIDSQVLADAVTRFNDLSPATQEAVAPFLYPPFHSGSWWEQAQGGSAAEKASPNAVAICGPVNEKDWKGVEATKAPVKVWWQIRSPNDENLAKDTANLIDAGLWAKLVTLMGRQPLGDFGSTLPCRGGSDHLDIALIDQGVSNTAPYAEIIPNKSAPTFVLLSKASPNGLPIALIHELMHTVQYAYTVKEPWQHTKYLWLMEATAQWFQDYVLPAGDSGKEQRAAPSFLSVPHKPLETTGGNHEYGAYLLFFFLARKFSDASVVKRVWEATESNADLEAVNVAIGGGFKERWPEFALHNWNREQPLNYYEQWDSLKESAALLPVTVNLAGGEQEIELDSDVEHLAARYYQLKFSYNEPRSLIFLNGLGFKLSKKTLAPEVGPQFWVENVDDETKKGVGVRALIKVENEPWREQDWTNAPMVEFCRDARAERLEELVIIVSNSEHKDRQYKLKPAELKPRVWASNLGCFKWKGKIEVLLDDPPANITYDVTWRVAGQTTSSSSAVLPPGGIPAVNYFYALESGTHSWNYAGKGKDDCVYSGSGSTSFGPTGPLDALHTWNFNPPGGRFHRGYYGFLVTPRPMTITKTCPGNPPQVETVTMQVPGFTSCPPLGICAAAASGILEGSAKIDDGTAKWSFKPEME